MPTQELETTPNLALLFAKGVLPKRSGQETLPDVEFVQRDIPIDLDHLAAYDRICSFRLSDRLPVTYPHVPAFPLAIKIMTSPAFPFALPGLVHIRNRIVQHRALTIEDRLTVSVRAAGLRPHPKGTQFDVISTVALGDEDVWIEHSTYLKRGPGDESAERDERPEPPSDTRAIVEVPKDLGRRFATISGDRNPIHLSTLTARPFGFPKPIAHGMWTKARALAALEGRLPGALEVDAWFLKPVTLPSRIALAHDIAGGRITFAVRKDGSDTVHLSGTIEPVL